MRNVNKELRDAIEAAKLEIELKKVLEKTDEILIRIETYASCVASLYNKEEQEAEFIAEMQMKQAELLKLVNKLNDIGMRAMAINDRSIVFKSETEKAKVVAVMEKVRNLYM